MSGGDVGGEKGVEERDGGLVLSARGAEDACEDGEGMSAGIGARAEGDFTREHGTAESAFGMVVGGRHAGAGEEGEELLGVAFRGEESVAQIESLGMGELGGADGLEAPRNSLAP